MVVIILALFTTEPAPLRTWEVVGREPMSFVARFVSVDAGMVNLRTAPGSRKQIFWGDLSRRDRDWIFAYQGDETLREWSSNWPSPKARYISFDETAGLVFVFANFKRQAWPLEKLSDYDREWILSFEKSAQPFVRWTLPSGEHVEARLLSLTDSKAIVCTQAGHREEWPLSKLSERDRKYAAKVKESFAATRVPD